MTVVGEYPPGSRVRVRGEEWMVERTVPLPMGGVAIHAQGLSELVRHHKAVFLSEIEERIEVLLPEDTQLVSDDSPGYRRTRLFLETLLRRTPPTDALVHIGHRGALDVMPYQLYPAHKALSALRPRLLLADGTGLGKTVEVGILLSELIKRGRARRILVVAIKSMLAQLQRELWARFTIPLVRLDSEGLARVQRKIPTNRNPFSHFDRCILSVDTLKNNARYRAWLEEIRWDVIVVDECHNVANRGSQREQLARMLATQCDALVLTSATPHNGKPESFANLMRMLDPTAIADDRQFGQEDVARLYVRRFKKDVEEQTGGALKDRETHLHPSEASREEEEALAALHALSLKNLGRKRHTTDRLLTWALVKAFLSSPQAALETIDERIKNTARALEPGEDGTHPYAATLRKDLDRLTAVRAKVEAAATKAVFGKLARFLKELRAAGFTGKASSPRVVVFSERIATLEMLKDAVAEAFGIADKDAVIGRFDASSDLTDIQQREVVESFGRTDSPMRLLLASDAASEGVNLHYHCAQLFHFDIPWSLIRLTQRNGRIDRFGQKSTPHLHYMVTRTRAVTADQHVVDRVIEKEKTANQQLGDVGALLQLYDAESEEKYLLEGVAAGRSADELIPDAPLRAGEAEEQVAALAAEEGDGDELASPSRAPEHHPAPPAATEPGDVDLLALLAATSDAGADFSAFVEPAPAPGASAATGDLSYSGSAANAPPAPEPPGIDLLALLQQTSAAEAKAPPIEKMAAGNESLFPDDHAFLVAAARHLEKHPVVGEAGLSWEHDDAHHTVKITAPEPFRVHREPFLPAEAVPENGVYQLVQSKDEIARRLRAALEGDGSWPTFHLLWEQHPLLEWLLDALAASYARMEAPVLRVPSLPKGTALFLLAAQLYNRESTPVFARWFAVESRGLTLVEKAVPFAEVVSRVGLGGELVNQGKPSSRTEVLQGLVKRVVDQARSIVSEEREESVKRLRKRVRDEERRVAEWYGRSIDAIKARRRRYEGQVGRVPLPLENKLRREEQAVEGARKNHREWMASLQAAGAPYVRLVAVFSGE